MDNLRDLFFEKPVKQISEYFKQELIDEFLEQGHRDTGKFEKSVEYQILTNTKTIEIVFSYLKYGIFLEKGVSAANIPFGGSSSRKSVSLYIEALKDWAARKGMKNPLGAAFAIAKTHKKQGMPSKGSYKFSSNGRRKNFQSFVLKANATFVNDFFSSKDLNMINSVLIDILNNTVIK